MKRDAYFYRSAIATLLVYAALLGLLAAFALWAGAAGVFALLACVVLLLIYFYGGFRGFSVPGGACRKR